MTDDIQQKLKELQSVIGSRAKRLWFRYLLCSDLRLRKHIETKIHLLHARQCGTGAKASLCPPSKNQASGTYPVGWVTYNRKVLYPFGLRESELSQHALVVGRSGAGKTTLVLGLIEQLRRAGKPFIVFSFKREHRGLVRDSCHDPLYFTCGRPVLPFFFNPLVPPRGTPNEVWNAHVCDAIATTFMVGEAAVSVLKKGLSEVRAASKQPRLMDLKFWLDQQASKGRSKEWLATARRALDALCLGTVGQVVNHPESLPLEWLLDKQIVLELDALGETERAFLVQVIMRYLYLYALENFPRNACRFVVMCDEAHKIFSNGGNITGREHFADTMMRMAREVSLGFVLVDQHPSLLNQQVAGNVFATISLHLKTTTDINAVAGMMGLSAEQRACVGHLKRGEAVVRLADRYQEPFLISIPPPSPSTFVPDEKLRQAMVPRLTALGVSWLSASPSGDTAETVAIPGAVDGPSPSSEIVEALTPEERQFLASVVQQPFMAVTERYRFLGLGTRSGDAIKRKLLNRGLVSAFRVHVPGNTRVLLAVTTAGQLVLKELDVDASISASLGGLEHRFGIFQVRHWFERRGFTCAAEVQAGNKHAVDLVASKDGEEIAIEVETGKSDIAGNVQACLDAGFAAIVVVATNRAAYGKIMKIKEVAAWPAQVQVAYLEPGEHCG